MSRVARPPAEIPPHDAEIERTILGIALYGDEGAEVLAQTRPEHFWVDKNREIRARMQAMAEAGEPIDMITLRSALDAAGELDRVGGPTYLWQLHGEATVLAHLRTYIRRLVEFWVKREMLGLAKRLGTSSQNGVPAAALVRETQAQLEAVATALVPLRAPEQQMNVLSWAAMTSAPPEPIAYHFPGWVPLGSVALLVGAGDSLKSWIALVLAVCTASGHVPLVSGEAGTPSLKTGPVLYITAENALAEEQRRCRLLKAGLGLPDELPITFVPAENLSLGQDEDYAGILRLVEQHRPVGIFIDSAIALSGIADENSNTEVRDFMKRQILPLSRKYGATVYVIAHSPKPPTAAGQRFTDEHVARGAGDWRNAPDVVLYLRRDATLGPQAVVLRHSKIRTGPRQAPIWFALEDVVPGESVRMIYGGTFSDDTSHGATSGLSKAVTAAVEVLRSNPSGVYRASVEKQIIGPGISKATARRACDVIRGKKPWPHGPRAGQKHSVVLEDRDGKNVFLTLDAALAPPDEDVDDA